MYLRLVEIVRWFDTSRIVFRLPLTKDSMDLGRYDNLEVKTQLFKGKINLIKLPPNGQWMSVFIEFTIV